MENLIKNSKSPEDELRAVDQDRMDLDRARKDSSEKVENKPWYKVVGPGLVTGAADDDPSGIATYSANGAQFGYQLLWLVVISMPLMIAVQEMCGRIAAVTGQGLASVIKTHYPKWLLFTTVLLLIVANVFNIYADLSVMASSTTMLLGLPNWVGLVLFTAVLITSQIFIPYAVYAKFLKWLCLSLLGYVIVGVMPGMKTDWSQIGRHIFVPSMDLKPQTVLAVVAFLGTTISPYLFFWQAGETVEESIAEGASDEPGSRERKVTRREIRNIRADTTIGMVASQIVAFFVVVAAASSLHAHGKTEVNTAQDAAKALLALGPGAYWIFTFCIIGTGLLAIPTLAGSTAYAIAETTGWRYGLYRRFERARPFYVTIAVVILLGFLLNFVALISPIKALVYSAALNGVIAPPLIVVLLLICNNKKIIGDRTNGPWANVFGVVAVAAMAPAAIYLIWAMLRGQA